MKTLKLITFDAPFLATEYICWAELGHHEPAQVEIEYDYDPGQREVRNAAPEDCEEGCPASVTITSIKLLAPCLLHGEKCLAFLNAGFELVECFDHHYIGKLRDEILTEKEAEALAYRLHGAAALEI